MLAWRHYSTMLKPKHCEECFFGRLVAESCEFAGLQNAAIRRFLDHTMKGVVANREPGSYYMCVRVSYFCSMSHTICLEALARSVLPVCRCSFRKMLISRGPAEKTEIKRLVSWRYDGNGRFALRSFVYVAVPMLMICSRTVGANECIGLMVLTVQTFVRLCQSTRVTSILICLEIEADCILKRLFFTVCRHTCREKLWEVCSSIRLRKRHVPSQYVPQFHGLLPSVLIHLCQGPGFHVAWVVSACRSVERDPNLLTHSVHSLHSVHSPISEVEGYFVRHLGIANGLTRKKRIH